MIVGFFRKKALVLSNPTVFLCPPPLLSLIFIVRLGDSRVEQFSLWD